MQQHTWFYSFSQALTDTQISQLEAAFSQFLANWKSHGTPIEGKIAIEYQHFVIIQSQPNDERPSGCSIDSMKKAVEQILVNHGLTWTDASQIFYQNEAGEVVSTHFKEISNLIKNGQITTQTLVFDHSLNQSDDITQWKKPIADTWLKRMFR